MEPITKTYKNAQEIIRNISYGINDSVNDKLTYAATKVLKNIGEGCKAINETLQEKIADLHVSNALTDKSTGALLTKEGNKGDKYMYSPEGQLKLNKEIKAAQDAVQDTPVTFEPFYTPDCPRIRTISLDILESLSGILFDPELVESILNPKAEK